MHWEKTARTGRAEAEELYRRRFLLLLYLLRSPLYDAATKRAVAAAVGFAARNLPLGGKIAELLLAYIPHYRSIYSYLWAN